MIKNTEIFSLKRFQQVMMIRDSRPYIQHETCADILRIVSVSDVDMLINCLLIINNYLFNCLFFTTYVLRFPFVEIIKIVSQTTNLSFDEKTRNSEVKPIGLYKLNRRTHPKKERKNV